MKKRFTFLQAGLLILLLLTTYSFVEAREKYAQSGFQFLSVISDGHAAALGGAITARDFNSSSLFFNPAGMARMTKSIDVAASQNKWIADITHNNLSLAIKPQQGQYGVFGFSLQSVDYGKIYGTVRDVSVPEGYTDTGMIEPSALAIGIGYAKAITDRFAVGGQIRYVKQDLGRSTIPIVLTLTDTVKGETQNVLSPFTFDFGTIYRTAFKGLAFGVSVRNYAKEIKYAKEGFELPLTFTMGIMMDLMNLLPEMGIKQSAVLSADASHFRARPGQTKIGLDYKLIDVLSLRLGYVSNTDQESFSYGMGVSLVVITFDYAYTPYSIFDDVSRITIRFSR